MFPVSGIHKVTMLVLDVSFVNIPREPKLYAEFVRQLGDVAMDNGGSSLVAASADTGEEKVALFYLDADHAKQFEADWRRVARKVASEVISARGTMGWDTIPF